jgi:ferredoxin
VSDVPLRIEIDQSLCLSSGKCVGDAPGVFAFDDHEIAHVITEHHELDDRTVLRIARSCPGQAVIIRDESGELVDL